MKAKEIVGGFWKEGEAFGGPRKGFTSLDLVREEKGLLFGESRSSLLISGGIDTTPESGLVMPGVGRQPFSMSDELPTLLPGSRICLCDSTVRPQRRLLGQEMLASSLFPPEWLPWDPELDTMCGDLAGNCQPLGLPMRDRASADSP